MFHIISKNNECRDFVTFCLRNCDNDALLGQMSSGKCPQKSKNNLYKDNLSINIILKKIEKLEREFKVKDTDFPETYMKINIDYLLE